MHLPLTSETSTTPTISVVMPVYNGAKTIREAIESIFVQTLQPTEILVVDDGSSDNTLEILAEYRDRITVLKQKNQGHASARNLGMKQATGEFIAILDADDQWLSGKLARQVEFSSSADVIYTNAINFGEIERVEQETLPVKILADDDYLCALLLDNFITHSSVLLRRDAALAVGGYDPSLRTAPDWDLWLRMAQQNMRFHGVPEPQVRYRWVSTSNSKNHTMTCKDRIRVVNAALERSDNRRISKKLRRDAMRNVWRTSAWFAANDQPMNAFIWYLHALKIQPTSSLIWKDLLRTALHPLGLRAS